MFKRNIFHISILFVLIALAVSTWQAARANDGLLRIDFLDIGQGDATLITAPNGNQILIDGGPDRTVLTQLAEIMPLNDRLIDAVLVSHPHTDHIAGLIDVLERYDVPLVVQAKESYDSPVFEAWQDAVAREDAQELEAIAGTQLTLAPDLTLTIFHPYASVAGTSTQRPHDDIVVAILQYRQMRLLLTGDMEAKVERRLVADGVDLDTDILKVGHHGSNTSSTTEFLSAVTPTLAVIEVGKGNRYRHPSPNVLARLESSGIQYLRTDMHGRVSVVSDGFSFRAQSAHE